jgi:hypothetical protein
VAAPQQAKPAETPATAPAPAKTSVPDAAAVVAANEAALAANA